VFDQLRKCGSAAKRATPEALKRLQDPDQQMQRAAAQFVSAMGPAHMPEVLRQAAEADLAKAEALVNLLMTEGMWDEAALKDPRAVVIATKMLDLPKEMDYVKQFGLGLLAKVGGGSRDLVPKLVVMLGDPDAERRASIRAALVKIDPDWMKHPQNRRALPALVPVLESLPDQERDELYGALGELHPEDVDVFIAALASLPEMTKDKKLYRIDGFEVVQRLRGKLKAALPAFIELMEGKRSETRIAWRVRSSLLDMDLDETELKPALRAALHISMDQSAVNYLKKFQARLVPFIDDLLDDKNEMHRHLGLVMALELAPHAKSLLPKIIARLSDPDVPVSYNQGKDKSRALTLKTLAAIEKDWAKHPSVRAALAPLIADAGPYHPREIRPIYKLLRELGPAARPSVPDIIRTMVVSKSAYFNLDSALAIDKIDPNWRDDPTVKEILPEVIARFAKGNDFIAEQHLKFLGPAAAAELEKALPTLNSDARSRAAALLGAAGGSTDAVAALFQQLSDPKLAAREAGSILKSLAAMRRDWATLPEVRKATPEVLAKLATPDTHYQYVAVATALGPAGVPELLKHLADANSLRRQLALAGLSEIGAPAASAVPAVIKALKDKDVEVRKRAVYTVGRIGAGKKELVAALAPAFLDQDSEVFRNVPDAMDRLDKDWKKSPKLNPVVNQLLKSLGDPDPKVRGVALYSLSWIGPAPGVVAAVEKLAKQEKDGNVRQQALNVLDSFKRQ
jgi:HEAT repeat protein